MREQILNHELIFVKAALRRSMTLVGMIRILHVAAVFILVLALGLVGTTRAMALHQVQPLAAMVICSGEGTETIYLDANGNPVDHSTDCATCPDCIGGSVPFLPSSTAAQVSRTPAVASGLSPAFVSLPPAPHLRPETRGPPPVAHDDNDLAHAAAPVRAAMFSASGACHRNGRSLTEART